MTETTLFVLGVFLLFSCSAISTENGDLTRLATCPSSSSLGSFNPMNSCERTWPQAVLVDWWSWHVVTVDMYVYLYYIILYYIILYYIILYYIILYYIILYYIILYYIILYYIISYHIILYYIILYYILLYYIISRYIILFFIILYYIILYYIILYYTILCPYISVDPLFLSCLDLESSTHLPELRSVGVFFWLLTMQSLSASSGLKLLLCRTDTFTKLLSRRERTKKGRTM